MTLVAFPLAYRTGIIDDAAFGYIAGRRSNQGVACLEQALNHEAAAMLQHGFEPELVTIEVEAFFCGICQAAAGAGHPIPVDVRVPVRCLSIEVYQLAEDRTG